MYNNNYYIKSKGSLQTFVNNNNNNKFNEIDWDAGYDGDVANVILSSNNNGNQQIYNVKLDNEDLANLLNVPSISGPIDKRLQMDFNNNTRFRPEPNIYKIELPVLNTYEPEQINHSYKVEEPESIENILESMKQPNGYLSSPLSNEELIVPISIDDKTLNQYTLTPNKHHAHKKTHKTYRVYKKNKTHRKSTRNSTRKSSKPLSIF